MREILFRGKTTKEKEWVYGDLLHDGYDYDVAIWEQNCKLVTEIFPETVGQFTGLTDKNGKRIFEGDIVRDAQISMFGKVVYATPQDGFDGIAGFMVDDIDDGLQNYNGFWHQVEVIGNIHDNPELLEVTDNA